MSIYKTLSPFLDRRDSETWHGYAVEALHFMEREKIPLQIAQMIALGRERYAHENLHTTIGSVALENPTMVGAGWDKKGRAVRGLHALGFSGVEVGSVLEHPQPGNEKPRQFFFGDGVSLNRLGFNSPGMDVVAANLDRYRTDDIPIGISIGKNKEVSADDAPAAHAAVAERMADYASYFAINVSSPNTPGLRALQDKEPLRRIAQAVRATLRSKGHMQDIFVKIAPELTPDAINDVIDVVYGSGLTGIVASNTTISPDLKGRYGRRDEAGGLSGNDPDFRAMSVKQIAHIYRETKGKISIIGVGGVKDAETALEKIRAGASAVQLVTALRGEGPSVANEINRGISKQLRREGVKNIREIVGVDA